MTKDQKRKKKKEKHKTETKSSHFRSRQCLIMCWLRQGKGGGGSGADSVSRDTGGKNFNRVVTRDCRIFDINWWLSYQRNYDGERSSAWHREIEFSITSPPLHHLPIFLNIKSESMLVYKWKQCFVVLVKRVNFVSWKKGKKCTRQL